MRDPHPLGPPGGAGGVEEPGQIIRCAGRGAFDRRALSGRQRRNTRPGKRRLMRGIGQHHARARVGDDPCGLCSVQLGVDRHGGGPGIPDAIERQQVVG